MATIVRREFVGSHLYSLFLCLPIITLPYAVIYLIEGTVTIEEQIDRPETFLDAFRSGKLLRRGG
jgi:hypothetical protein